MLQEKLLYSISEVSKFLGVSRGSVQSMIDDGRLQTIKLGSQSRVKAESLRNLIGCVPNQLETRQ